jgi:hypothetical protein
MSTEQMPLGFPALHYVEVQTGRTVNAGFAMKAAHAADILALARPTKTLRADNLAPGVFKLGFTRSPGAKLLYLSWWYRAHISITAGDQLSVSLTVDDGTLTVGPVNAKIPIAFQGNAIPLSLAAVFTNPAGMTLGGEGWIDISTSSTGLANVLTASDDWTFTFTIARPVGTVAYVDRIEGGEIPAGLVSDIEALGATVGPLNPGNPITAGSAAASGNGWERIMATLQGAIAAPVEYLTLAWMADITATIPKTSSAAFAALTNFSESAGVPIVFRVRVRPMTVVAPPGTAAGEAARFRVLYWVAGGGTAQVRVNTGATGSPYAATGLTGAAWTWSAWTACALPTDGTDQVARLTFEAKTSAGTVYLAAVVVESVAP